MLKRIFFKIYRRLTFNRILNFEQEEPDVDRWQEFLDSVEIPKDDYEISYAKYRSRMFYFSKRYAFIANVSAFFAFIISIPILLRKMEIPKGYMHDSKYVLVKSINVDYIDIIPDKIQKDYGESIIIEKKTLKNKGLIEVAKEIFRNTLRKHPFSFHYNYLVFRELGFYSNIISNYDTKAIVVYVNERNVVSPLISNACESIGIDFVTFMHGEYVLQLIQAYMRFTKFYVWDQHYTQMFTQDLKCPAEQFEVYTPGKLIPKYEKKSIDEYEYFATYYFGAESQKRIEKVSEIFNILKKQGKICKVRPHPRRSNLKAIVEAFDGIMIEDTSSISVKESIESSKYIIALSSTVLSEAYYSGKEIVIDDYSEPEKYENLKKRKYIMMYKDHKLLSDLINID